ncbi:heme-binding protein [Georgenia sp. AZ-5]|uniref:GlcG/HbpS family heme-binding protein n=1 Tax=Georgenia sp. AZ-5 TaxID=3367526 RepID=UPI003754D0AD
MGLGYERARQALEAALQKATEIGSASSVAIVDEGRELIAFARQDGALLASTEISAGKAYTACSMRMATKDIAPLTQPGAPLYGLEHTHLRPLVTFGGGRVLEVDGEVVGAVGVAGGTVDQDDEIAAAAAAALASP